MQVFELNMDGLVGPTHHYAGLSKGNLASMSNALATANPAAAAQQGISKMRFLHKLGLKQGILPPHARPNIHFLKALGFSGTPEQIIKEAKKTNSTLLSAAFSASSMWAANTATIAPGSDSADGRVHFTPANLVNNLHRHQEAFFSSHLLKKIFAHSEYFMHHNPLPANIITSDEGAANHSRLCTAHDAKGFHLFVFGKHGLASTQQSMPQKFPARQTFEASQSIARLHQLAPNQVFFACQNPAAIDAGVFHNDVIAVANESLLLIHEHAFMHQEKFLQELQQNVDFPIQIITIKNEQLTIPEAVQSYLFNSQLVTLADKKSMALIAPEECHENLKIKQMINHLITDTHNPIKEVHFMNLRQSMLNGGGPACLRLRIVLKEQELNAMHQGVLVTEELLTILEHWVNKHYRTQLHANDLDDPNLITECYTALDELTQILNLGSIYSFQQNNSNPCF